MHHYNHSPLDPLRVSASNTPEPSSSSAMRYNVGRTSARNLSAGDSHDEERKYAILFAATLCAFVS